jgi:hypothetical protein
MPKINFENKNALKATVNQKYHETISDLMSEKVRIRQRRNNLAERQAPLTARKIYTPQIGQLDAEIVMQKMTKTTNEWTYSP